MNYWLVKSEPSVYSWEQFVKDGSTSWEGIRNYAARLHLRAMKKNDQVLFYHSNEGVEIVGVARVIKEFYPDKSAEDDKWSAVDLKPVRRLKNPVTLTQIKKEKRLKDMTLVRISRLSVSPVTDVEFGVIMELSEAK